MIDLPNGCRCGKMSVHPENWEQPGARTKNPWYINYWFYDASGAKKQISVRGMNHFKKLADRRAITKQIMEDELALLLHEGYNPITGKSYVPPQHDFEIPPETPFIFAMQKAAGKLKCSQKTKTMVLGAVKIMGKAARDLHFDAMPVNKVMRKHIKHLLEHLQATRNMSPGNFNHYRAYLMMVFAELLDQEAIENDPVSGIKKQEEVRKIRQTLTVEERKIVDSHLQKHHYTFWRYLHIFFHSGSRSAELLRVQGKDVNLEAQFFKRTIIKGKKRREVKTMIKDNALPYWKEVMQGCGPDQYVFARGLVPGDSPIHPDQITKRWYRLVKGKLGITADFYSVKHLHTDAVSELLGIDVASSHNGHSSLSTTRIYAVNQVERENEKLKKLNNKF